MNPYFQQPQLWVNTNKSTMIVLGRLCIMYRMNNGNSQSHQCISHFFLKCRHIFQAIRAWVVFFPMWIIKRPVKGHWLISSPRSGGKLGKKKKRSAHGMLAYAIRKLADAKSTSVSHPTCATASTTTPTLRAQLFANAKQRQQLASVQSGLTTTHHREPVRFSWCRGGQGRSAS